MQKSLRCGVLCAAFVFACALPVFGKDKGAPGAPPQGMPPTVVEAAKVAETPWQLHIETTGTLSASQGVMLKSEVAGRVTGVYFRSGTPVQAGTLLVQLNPDILKAQWAAYEAKLKLDKLVYERLSKLYAKRAVSKADFDTAAANLKASEEAVHQAQAQLQQTRIVAPFSGQLGLRWVSLGDYVTAGQNIGNLQTLDPLRVDFTLPQVYVGQVAPGAILTVRADAYPQETFTGTVYALDSAVDPGTRTFALRASLPNKGNRLLPGAFVSVTVLAGHAEPALTLPQTAIVSDEDGSFVYKIVDGHAVKTRVTLGPRGAQEVVVRQGLTTGDTVVTAGQIKLHDGAPVMIRPPAAK